MFKGPAQFRSGLDPLSGLGRQRFGVKGIAITPAALGLEQRRVGVAQQLLGTQGVTGEQADTDAGVDEQPMPVDIERLLEALDDPLGQRRGLHQLRTALGQHGELITTQARQGDCGVEHRSQAFGHRLEYLVTDRVPKAVVDHHEVIQIDHQQRATPLVQLRRCQGLGGAVGEQQAIGQAGKRIVMGQVPQFVFRILDGADIGKYRHEMTATPQVVVNHANGLPLRIDFAAFAPVPDFAAPLADAVEGGEHRLIEGRWMMP
ncbi:hypothetical protein D3C73_924210 [compost metagenome]